MGLRSLAIAAMLGAGLPGLRAQLAEVSRYDVDQGLPQSMVNHVLQDTDGFIWLGTGDGLARFDGTRYVVYKHDPKDTTTLSNNAIWGLGEADAAHLWVGTRTGLDRLDRRSGKFSHMRTGLPGATDGCWRPVQVQGDTSWFYSPLNAMFLRIDRRGTQLFPSGHQPSYDMHPIAAGVFRYFVAPDSLIVQRPGLPEPPAVRLPISVGEEVSDVQPLKDGYLVLSHTDAWLWSPKEGRRELPPGTRTWMCHGPARKLAARDAQGGIWVTVNDRGVVRLKADMSIAQVYPVLPAQEGPLMFTGVAFDRQGDTWACTDGKGVFKIAPQAIKFGRIMPGMGIEPELRSYFVRRFAQWDSTHVLINFYHGDFVRYDERTGSMDVLPITGVPPKADVRQLVIDREGILWMVADSLLLAYHIPQLVPVLRMRCDYGTALLLDEAEHTVMVDTHGAHRWDAGTARFEPMRYDAMGNFIDSLRTVPRTVLFDDRARFWTAPLTAPMEIWNASGRHSLSAADRAAVGDEVRLTGLQPTGDGFYWTTSNAGLFQWDAGRLQVVRGYTIHDGLPDQYLYGLLPGDRGHDWWISSNNGLSHFDAVRGSFTNYGRSDGLQSKEFNLRALFRSRSGRLYFGGVNGVNHFLPSEVRNDTDRALVRVVGLRDDTGTMETAINSVTLPYPRNRLELTLAVLEFTAPDRDRYRYRIPGYIDEWRTGPPSVPLVLERVPAGDYVLEVQGINGDGVAAPVQQLLAINVPLPFWASRWAFVLAGSLMASVIAVLIFLAYRRRINVRERIAEQEMKELRVRTRLAKDIHDDVGSGLARIAALTRLGESGDERLKKVSDISTELLANLRDVVWMNDPRHDDLAAMLLRIKDHAFDLFDSAGVEVRVELPDPLPQRAIDGTTRHHLFLIAKEALHNTSKYAGAHHVLVRFTLHEDEFTLEVADDGGGLPADTTGTEGNGLRNMRQRAAAMRAELDITSSADAGVRVLLRGSFRNVHEQRSTDPRSVGGG